MRTDHAIVITEQRSLAEMAEYLARKANRLGIQGREIVRVYIQEDTEGKHVYFETTDRKFPVNNVG